MSKDNEIYQIFAIVSNHICEDQWDNTILRDGEIGILRKTEDKKQNILLKIGDGSTMWDELPIPNNEELLTYISAELEKMSNKIMFLEQEIISLKIGHPELFEIGEQNNGQSLF